MLHTGTYRAARGGLLHCRRDGAGALRLEVEAPDGSLREGCAVCDCDVLLSDDPEWPWADPRSVPSLAITD